MDMAVQVQHVTLKSRKKTLLYDINLDACQGEIVGILGANGSGKTVLMQVLTGQRQPDEGQVLLHGVSLTRQRAAALLRTGCILEENHFFPYLTGMQNLRMFAGMRPDISSEELTHIIRFTGLMRCIHHKVRTYSKGMRQRLAIAQALIHHPSILLLDEPAAGLDPGAIRNLREHLRMLAQEQHTCVLLTTNLLSEAELMCDRVVMLSGGRIAAIRSMEELTHTTGGTHTIYRFRISDAALAQLAARQILEAPTVLCDVHTLELPLSNHDTDHLLAKLVYQFISWGIDVYTIYPIDNRTLEDAFLEITQSGGTQLD